MQTNVLLRNHVNFIGSGEPTIVLGHGFGTDQTVWKHQIEALAPHHRLVLFDHVGAGRSDWSAYSSRRYTSYHGYAADLLEILSAAEVKEAVYIGHSMSGMIGVLAALEQPDRFTKLILIGASPRYLEDEGYHGGFKQSDIDALYNLMASNYHSWASGLASTLMGNPDRPELAAEFATSLSSLRPDIARAVTQIIFQSDYRAQLPELTVPTLILQTTDDAAVPLWVGHYLAEQIPKAELQIIQAHGHLPHVSAPAAVIEAIGNYMAV